MGRFSLGKIFLIFGLFLLGVLVLRYLLPVFLPFLLGALLALAAEPAVKLSVRYLKLPRSAAAGLGVTATLLLLAATLSLVGALAVKELGSLAKTLPDIQNTAQQGMALLQDWLMGIAQQSPEGIRPLLTRTAQDLFSGEPVLMEQVTSRLPGFFTAVLGKIPNGALGLGVGILSGFMISVRLPRLKKDMLKLLPASWQEKYLPALKRVRDALGGWLKAQLKLSGITYVIVAAGFLFLRIPYGFLLALLVALVDAVPLLGTGTVLLPWALVAFLQADHMLSVGLLCIYGVAALTRTVLEPRLVGKHLGLDPLVTLVFLYLGYRFWGIFGMVISPMLATAAKSFTETTG